MEHLPIRCSTEHQAGDSRLISQLQIAVLHQIRILSPEQKISILSPGTDMITDGWPGGRTPKFINFVLDPDRGQLMIEEAGFIPLR